MLPLFKSQKLMLAVMAFALLTILMLFGYLRIGASTIDLPTYHALLNSGTLQKAVVDENEVTLVSSNARYVIIKDGIDISELLKKVPIEVHKSNPLMQDLILLGVLVSAMAVLLLYGRK